MVTGSILAGVLLAIAVMCLVVTACCVAAASGDITEWEPNLPPARLTEQPLSRGST